MIIYLDVLVALERSVQALFGIQGWILSLVDVVENFDWNVSVDLVLCLIDVFQACWKGC